ncbi:MAG: metallophosphoesterase family protein [Bacillota bacterium]|nr:metallophosphoesterase family protein [Bacillota bacterium]
MRLALISDIHSNLEALKAVIADIDTRKVNHIICAGDLVGYAPFPNEVIDLIQKREIPTVLGNYDDSIGFNRMVCGCDYKNEAAQRLGEQSIAWTKTNTREESKELLRNLPKELRIEFGGHRILIVHGSPRQLNEYLYQHLEEKYLLEVMEENNTDILICGHTHLPFHRQLKIHTTSATDKVKTKHVINVGSIGKPKHGNPNAIYTIVNIGERVAVEYIEVPYDYEKTAQAIESSELPNEFAELLRNGTG